MRALVVFVAACATAPAPKPSAPTQAVIDVLALPETPDAPFRATKPPTAASAGSFAAPLAVEAKLANGARVLVVENHAMPLIAIDIALPIGAEVVPIDKAGLSKFVTTMLTEGTRRLPRIALAERLGDLALDLDAQSDREMVHVRIDGLAETAPDAIALVAGVLTEPAFAADDVERIRGVLQAALARRKAWPTGVAWDEAERLLFGAMHPLGQSNAGTEKSLAAITRADLVAFHDRWYRPDGAVIAISGDITPAAAVALLEKHLGSWRAKPSARPTLPALPALHGGVTLIDVPGTSQTTVYVIGRWPSARDPDRVAGMILSKAFGELFGSRLNLNLRETKGWTYRVTSEPDALRASGLIEIFANIETPFTAEALAEYYKEIETMRLGVWRAGELDKARAAIIHSLPTKFESNVSIAATMAQLALDGLPLDYYRTLPDAVAKVSEAELARVAKAYLVPAQMPAIVVGPRTSEAKLRALNRGPIEVR